MRRSYMLNNKIDNRKRTKTKIITTIAILIFVIYLSFVSVELLAGFDKLKNVEAKEKVDKKEIVEVNKNIVSKDIKEIRITPQTEFIFRTYYEKDNNTIDETKRPNSYDVNLTISELEESYANWDIISHTADRVIFYKSVMAEAPNYYVIGEKDGYMAIYYEDPLLGLRLREITDRLISSFEINEQEKIKNGIKVYGEENLIKLLEDYIS